MPLAHSAVDHLRRLGRATDYVPLGRRARRAVLSSLLGNWDPQVVGDPMETPIEHHFFVAFGVGEETGRHYAFLAQWGHICQSGREGPVQRAQHGLVVYNTMHFLRERELGDAGAAAAAAAAGEQQRAEDGGSPPDSGSPGDAGATVSAASSGYHVINLYENCGLLVNGASHVGSGAALTASLFGSTGATASAAAVGGSADIVLGGAHMIRGTAEGVMSADRLSWTGDVLGGMIGGSGSLGSVLATPTAWSQAVSTVSGTVGVAGASSGVVGSGMVMAHRSGASIDHRSARVTTSNGQESGRGSGSGSSAEGAADHVSRNANGCLTFALNHKKMWEIVTNSEQATRMLAYRYGSGDPMVTSIESPKISFKGGPARGCHRDLMPAANSFGWTTEELFRLAQSTASFQQPWHFLENNCQRFAKEMLAVLVEEKHARERFG